jgi:hypothetical protein
MPINWGELLSALGVLAAICTGVQWLIAKALVEPMHRRSIEELKVWIAASFPSKDQFQAHCQIDEERMESIHRDLDHLRHQTGNGAPQR